MNKKYKVQKVLKKKEEDHKEQKIKQVNNNKLKKNLNINVIFVKNYVNSIINVLFVMKNIVKVVHLNYFLCILETQKDVEYVILK